MRPQFLAFIAVAGVALLAGCAATKSGDAEDIRYSGYLSSYTGLTATGDSDYAAYRYIKPNTDLSGYTAILVDKPEARMSDEAAASIGAEDMAYILGAFDESLRTTIGAKFKMTDTPGPGVLRLRSCLTDADSAVGALTPFSRILPFGIVLSTAKKVTTGTGVNVGKATAEMEIVDSDTGEQLGAGVDRRVGSGVARNVLSNWADVKSAFDLWAERVTQRLVENRLPTTK